MHITTPALLLGSLLLALTLIGLYAYGMRIGRMERDMQHEIQLDQLNSTLNKEKRRAAEQQHIADRYQQANQEMARDQREHEAIRVCDYTTLVQTATALDLAARTFDAFNAPQASSARRLRDECRSIAYRLGPVEEIAA